MMMAMVRSMADSSLFDRVTVGNGQRSRAED
jgi:hypothetical protein